MTTKVTVYANHGWPVDVFRIDPTVHDAPRQFVTRVKAGDSFDAYATSTSDILIHEVQPSEIAAEAVPAIETL